MDFEQEISKALSDPDIMKKVSGVLSSLNNNNNNNNKEETDSSAQNSAVDAAPLPIGNMLSSLGGGINDDRTKLLLAIKPFLSEKRAPYMDSAVTILKLASMGKLGKDLNLF